MPKWRNRFKTNGFLVLAFTILFPSVSHSNTYSRMGFGYSNCPVQWGGLYENVSEKLMTELAAKTNANGFSYHPSLKKGQIMLGDYPKGCKSPANLSWPLYLKTSDETKKGLGQAPTLGKTRQERPMSYSPGSDEWTKARDLVAAWCGSHPKDHGCKRGLPRLRESYRRGCPTGEPSFTVRGNSASFTSVGCRDYMAAELSKHGDNWIVKSTVFIDVAEQGGEGGN